MTVAEVMKDPDLRKDVLSVAENHIERSGKPGKYRIFKNEADNVVVEFLTK